LFIEIKPGICQSLCGKDPIVTQNGMKILVIYKWIKGDSILKMMKDNSGISLQIDLINSFDHIELAQDVANKKIYDTAIELCNEGIEKAKFVSRNKFDKNWLCKAQCGVAEVLLEIGDVESAAEAVRQALTINQGDNSA
jgi:hypothetical protein